MPCIICGSPDTVEAHLLPRGLVRRVAGDEQHALAGDTTKTGYRRDGKGVFDRHLLCRSHEEIFSITPLNPLSQQPGIHTTPSGRVRPHVRTAREII